MAIELETIDAWLLPSHSMISTLTLAELISGPLAASGYEKARRRRHLRAIEMHAGSIPFDSSCARAFAPVYEVVVDAGRKPRGARVVDLMIAATALAHELPLYTLNAADLRGLESLVEIVDLAQ